jgi:uncharacterized membrane protein YbhN (UPF0104 family)
MKISLSRAVVGVALLGSLCVFVAVTGAGRGTAAHAVSDLAHAQPGWLMAAAASCAVALLGSAAAWRVGLRGCGGTAGYGHVSARYAVGSLLNALAPAHVGSVVRLGLLSQTLPGADRLLRAGGVGAAMTALRALALGVLAAAAAFAGAVPWWTAAALAAGALTALAVFGCVGRRARGRLADVLAIFEVLRRSKWEAATLAGWITAALAARVVAASAVAAALSVPRPLAAGVVLIAAVSLAGVVPLTPGNLGTGAGAAALALHGLGVAPGIALATGLAFQAVETAIGVTLGLAGAAAVAAPGSSARRWSLGLVSGAAALAAAALGFVSFQLI